VNLGNASTNDDTKTLFDVMKAIERKIDVVYIYLKDTVDPFLKQSVQNEVKLQANISDLFNTVDQIKGAFTAVYENDDNLNVRVNSLEQRVSSIESNSPKSTSKREVEAEDCVFYEGDASPNQTADLKGKPVIYRSDKREVNYVAKKKNMKFMFDIVEMGTEEDLNRTAIKNGAVFKKMKAEKAIIYEAFAQDKEFKLESFAENMISKFSKEFDSKKAKPLQEGKKTFEMKWNNKQIQFCEFVIGTDKTPQHIFVENEKGDLVYTRKVNQQAQKKAEPSKANENGKKKNNNGNQRSWRKPARTNNFYVPNKPWNMSYNNQWRQGNNRNGRYYRYRDPIDRYLDYFQY